MAGLELSTKLLVTGERIDKATANGGKLVITFPQETLALLTKVSEKSGYSLEEVVVYYLESQYAEQASLSHQSRGGGSLRRRSILGAMIEVLD